MSTAVFIDKAYPLRSELLEGFDFVGVDGVVDDTGDHVNPLPASNCQYLWIKIIFYAASFRVVSSSGRSTSLPFSNRAPARTSATRCGAFTARQRDCEPALRHTPHPT